jgi:arylsulfatase
MASAFRGRAPWDVRKPITGSPLDDRWELYDLANDFSQSRDLAADEPAKLAQMQALFWNEAGRNQVLPIIDNAQTAGLPHLMSGRKRYTLYAGGRAIPEMQGPPVMMRSHTVTANINLPRSTKGGVIVAYGGVAGGWALHVDERRRPVYSYNYADAQTFRVVGDRPLPLGASRIELSLDYDKPMTGGPAMAVLKVDGRESGRTRIDRTVPFLFSIHETLDVGIDLGGPVTPAYAAETPFDGTIGDVVIDIR